LPSASVSAIHRAPSGGAVLWAKNVVNQVRRTVVGGVPCLIVRDDLAPLSFLLLGHWASDL
jgi:hypothetical protein